MFRVFYSWMSDYDSQYRQPVYHALVDALRKVCAQPDTSIPREERVVIQCGNFGGPTDINRFIFETLPTCHAHVVDLTLINHPEEPRTRRVPNPNNMLELGVALGRLGVARCVPVLNTDAGSPESLPFDVRNLNVVAYSGAAPQAGLAKSLAAALTRPAREYVSLRDGLVKDVRRCLAQPLPYFAEFLSAHARDAGIAQASIALFDAGATGQPVPTVLRELFRAFSRRALAQQASQQTAVGYTWGEVFAVLLRRLQADCRRLCHRYRDLAHATLFQAVQDLGLEAEHLERLFDRVTDRLTDPLLDDLIVEETVTFLTLLLGVQRSLARSSPEQLPPGLVETTPAGAEVRVLEPGSPAGSPVTDR